MTAIRGKNYKGKTKFLKMKTVPVSGILLASPSLGGKQRAQFDKTYKSALTRARLDPKKLHPQAQDKFSNIHPPATGGWNPAVFCSSAESISGKKPGRVYLRYQVGRETQATEFRKQEKVTKTITLLPYTGSWAKSWYSNLVVVKV
jgi:hypothetical protein